MGWAPATRLAGASYGMQGSNTSWSATALMDRASRTTVMVVANDGRSCVLRATALFAHSLLLAGHRLG